MASVHNQGLEIFYEDSGHGSAVVLGHSFLCSGDMWRHQVTALQTRFRVINPDLRGHGRSGHVGRPFSLYDAVSDVLAVLDRLEIDRATWCGLSEGTDQYPARGGWRAGQHLSLNTKSGIFEVHLGPADFWKQNGFELVKGESIQVTGSKVKVDDSEVILAREVKKGDKIVALRNARGIPAWSRGRRSP